MIVLIGGEKGGTGKSTLATNLAVCLAHRGRDVLLLDCDPQRSSASWVGVRSANAPDAPASRFVGVSTPWLRDLANKGRIPTLRTVGGVRLFKRRDLNNYIEERKRKPPQRGRPRKKKGKKTKA